MIYLIEHRTYQNGQINKNLKQAVSTREKAEDWIRDDQHKLTADDVTHCWFAVRQIGIDQEQTVKGVDYYRDCRTEPDR